MPLILLQYATDITSISVPDSTQSFNQYSFKTNGEFDRPFRDLERHDMTFALRHFKTLPAQQQVLEKAEFEKARTAWPSVQAKRIVDKNHEIELQKQEQVNLKAQKEHEARDAEIERAPRLGDARPDAAAHETIEAQQRAILRRRRCDD